jgi:cell division protein FtsL
MKTVRAVNVVFLAAMIVAAIVTYALKHQAEVAAENIGRLQADIAKERDKIRTLNAEWSFLNQPSRLDALVKEHADYFQLQPFTPDQVAAIDEIPMRNRPAGTDPTATTAINDAMIKVTLARIAAGGALREH